MSKRVVITGLGVVSGLGIGVDALWEGVCAGRSAIAPVEAFDATGFGTSIASEVRDFKVRDFVPKNYRKATKVMARDIELAVAAANRAVVHAGLVTSGTDADGDRTYEGYRSGCHIGAGLVAADIDELTSALIEAVDDQGNFDMHQWGREGMTHLTPLWLLKYLPNMLACHVTIIHDARGPSNTITCAEASSGLSIGESLRVIQRNAADMCFCGGAESKLNPMAFFRQTSTGRLTTQSNDDPARAVRPFDADAGGIVLGEGGGILTLESADTAEQRGARPYAELVGFGASHTIHPEKGGLEPDPEGRGIAAAIRAALRDAGLEAGAIDLVIPFGSGIPAYDRAEAAALRTMLGDRAADVPIWSSKPFIGNCGAGAGGIDMAVAAMALREQKIPAMINCDQPIDGLHAAAAADSRPAELNHVLVSSTGLGGQNVALILKRV